MYTHTYKGTYIYVHTHIHIHSRIHDVHHGNDIRDVLKKAHSVHLSDLTKYKDKSM